MPYFILFLTLIPVSSEIRAGFELAFEVRNFNSLIGDSVELLSHPTRLKDLAEATMRKLSGKPFLLHSRVERRGICPEGLVWDKAACRARGGLLLLLFSVGGLTRATGQEQQRSWVGLVLVLGMLVVLGWCCCNREEPVSTAVVVVEEEVGGSPCLFRGSCGKDNSVCFRTRTGATPIRTCPSGRASSGA
jgi:hypothetical protein